MPTRTAAEIAADFAPKATQVAPPTAPSSLWDTIKGYAKSAVESPSIMGAVGGTIGFGLGGPPGAALGAAGGAGYAHTARALDPARRAAEGVESPTSNAVDMVKQAAINAAVPEVVGRIGGPLGRLLQKIPSAPMPKGWGEAGVVGGLSMVPDIGHAMAGTYGVGRLASVAAPPVLRGLGRAAELGSDAVANYSGSLAPAAAEEAASPLLLGAKDATPYVLGTEPASMATGATNVSHLSQLPASATVEDLVGQGVPLEEAIAAAAKGEPAGMADSLRGLYKASGSGLPADFGPGATAGPSVTKLAPDAFSSYNRLVR
jgi:hypothetical protein